MLPEAQMAAIAASAHAVDVSIEDIKHIATGTFGDMQEGARVRADQFVQADIGESAFSNYPLARELGRQHQAAYAVFTETINGVIADLETLQSALLESAKEYEDTDDAAAVAMAAVDRRFSSNESLASYNNFNDERHDQGQALHTELLDVTPQEAAQPLPAAEVPSEDPYR